MEMRKILKRRKERGQGLVELALAMPMMVLILSGLVHFGLAFHTQQLITNASRIGARRATQPQDGSEGIQSTVISFCQQAGLDSSKVTVQVNIDNTAGQATVTVAYPFSSVVESIFQTMAGIFGQSASVPSQLQATTVMRL
jgi:Flp pilus assembly protein TadG